MRIVIEGDLKDVMDGYGSMQKQVIEAIERATHSFLNAYEGDVITYELSQADLKIEVSDREIKKEDRVIKTVQIEDVKP